MFVELSENIKNLLFNINHLILSYFINSSNNKYCLFILKTLKNIING